MEFQPIHVDTVFPLYLKVAVVSALLFVVLSIPLVRRARDPLALVIFSQWIMLGASWCGLALLARIITVPGPSHHAAAAWCAEAQAPLLLGAATAVILSVVLFITRAPATKPAPKSVGVSLGFVALLIAEAVFAWYLSRPGRMASPGLVPIGSAGILLSTAFAVYTASLAFPRTSNAPPASARAIAVTVLLLSVCFGFVVYTFAGRLMAEAAGF